MPLLPAYNALFIHIPKNAGRSIETALFPDNVTSNSGRRSVINRAAHLAQNVTGNAITPEYLVGTLDVSLSAQHLTLAEIDLLGLAPKQPLFTFCVVRNPYERAISSILHFRKRFSALYTVSAKPTPTEIERGLEVWADIEPEDHNLLAHHRPQADFVFRRGTDNAIDMVLRFETLSQDFATLCETIGASGQSLPWIGKSTEKNRSYRDQFTPRAREIVETMYGADLDLFDYCFN